MANNPIISIFAVIALWSGVTTAVAADEDPEGKFTKNLDALIDEMTRRKDDKKRRRDREALDSDKPDMQSDDLQDDNRDSIRKDLKTKWVETFQDTDFSKHNFDDLRSLSGASVFAARADWLKDSKDSKDSNDLSHRDSDRPDDSFLMDALSDYKRETARRDMRTKRYIYSERSGDALLHDWVPSDPDPTASGMFGLGADNGSPVPYKLNGWVVIERKVPWEEQ